MKVALIQANIGDFDDVRLIPEQSVPYDYFLITEDNLPYPLPNLNNRLKGKYVKINSHRFLTHDLFIWIDGRVEITSKDFIKTMIERAEGNDVVIQPHPERPSPYHEIEWIKAQMLAGSEYLKVRYEQEPFDREYKFYKKKGMPEVPLYACYAFARWNNKKVNTVFQDWWMSCLEFSNFDQTQFSYVAWRHKLKISEMTDLFDYLKLGKHK
jgi:Protein of unknown function (DUF616).